MSDYLIETPRLRIRQWQDSDLPAFAAINADPKVMRYFPACLSASQSTEAATRYRTMIAQKGFGLWAVERIQQHDFIGFIGIQPLNDALPCAPGTELGWRLASHVWRRGYATEGAVAVRDYAFGQLGIKELVSITAAINMPSRGVMEKIGMCNSGEDFLHPLVDDVSLAPHVKYRLAAK